MSTTKKKQKKIRKESLVNCCYAFADAAWGGKQNLLS
jgi:hypothetical protein